MTDKTISEIDEAVSEWRDAVADNSRFRVATLFCQYWSAIRAALVRGREAECQLAALRDVAKMAREAEERASKAPRLSGKEKERGVRDHLHRVIGHALLSGQRPAIPEQLMRDLPCPFPAGDAGE